MATSIRTPLLALATAIVALLAWAAVASAEVVYSAPPSDPPEGTAIVSPEVTEFGSPVQLSGSARVNPRVSLGLQSASAKGFTLPLTLKVYAVGSFGSPGPLLAEATQDAVVAAAPASSRVSWTLAGKTLPDEAIVTISFDASTAPGDELEVQLAETTVGSSPPFRYQAEAGGPLERQEEPAGEELRPAFTIEAEVAAALPPANGSVETASPAPATTTPPAVTAPSGPSLALRGHRMKVGFPQGSARLGGPGALIQLRCEGSAAARCMGTLTLSILGQTHKIPFSISKGRKQYVVVPLGDDLERIDSLRSPRAVVTASTLQERGGAVRTERILKLR